MKAAWMEQYQKTGARLIVGEREIPTVGERDVLLHVRTAAVNPLDNMILRGDVRAIVPYKMPLIMGNECVGIVEKAGSAAKKFQPGTRVYGRLPLNRIGAFAEYVAVNEDALAEVPENFSDEEAAAVPLTALTAIQALELIDAEAGKRIFISGGSGSFGAMAIPLAKARGLTVITSGSGKNAERVKALGADQFLDYRKQDYSVLLSDVDYVIDSLGGMELEKQFGILRCGGKLASLRGMPNGAFAARSGMAFMKRCLFRAVGWKYDRLAAKNNQQYFFVFVHSDGEQLAAASEILVKQNIRPAVDTIYDLAEVNQAMDKVAHGGSSGKTILQITHNV